MKKHIYDEKNGLSYIGNCETKNAIDVDNS